MDRAVRQWATSLPVTPAEDILADIHKSLSKSYVVYGDMILLATAIVERKTWKDSFGSHGDDSMQILLANICQCMKVTHIACNQPIPLRLGHAPDASTSENNILRSPIHFKPLYGDFGPIIAQSPPSDDDFSKAYWVTARQNGIAQTWAPRWTMFSRGNISEKARLLTLPSVKRAVEECECSAVDLYAGIGYFTFSFLKAGISKVLCWELNEWSCEGLRRGADSNRWSHQTVDLKTIEKASHIAANSARIVIFQESNEHATRRLSCVSNCPPVRHVNCGLLPTSEASWPTAFEALDAGLGGWVHVHENFGLSEIQSKAERVREAFQQMFDIASGAEKASVVLEDIQQVKSYAPGVWHCVMDIYVPPYKRIA